MNKSDIKKTIQSYDQFANEMAKKFDELGPRIKDIKEVIDATKKEKPRVLELGCANGRDASDILKYTDKYLGIDGSEKLIKFAKKRFPKAEFEVCTFHELELSNNSFDIVFDFASLFHYDKDSLKEITTKIADWLDDNGTLMMSIKKGKYEKIISQSGFGERTQYLYEPSDIIKMTKDCFKVMNIDEQNLKGQDWFTIILQKVSNE